jgi:hypothetical protein
MQETSAAPFGLSRETSIVRTADGRWFHDGEPMENPKLCHAFDGWITRAEDGRFCLKNEINWAYFQLEGAPYFVRSVTIVGEGAELSLSGGARVSLDFRTLREGPDGALYCTAFPGLAARLDSFAAVQLGELLHEDEDGPYFRVAGAQVRPPRVAQPLDDLPT